MNRPAYRSRSCAAFTLVEMMVVIAILIALAGVVVPLIDSQSVNTQNVAEQTSLVNLRNAWTSMIADVKYTPGFSYSTLAMSNLLTQGSFPNFDPKTGIGWRGPYVQGGAPVSDTTTPSANAFPNPGDLRYAGDTTFQARFFFNSDGSARYDTAGKPAIGDPWGNPIVLQVPAVNGADPELATPQQCWHFARLVSAGPDGILGTNPNDKLAGRKSDNSIDYTVRGQDDMVVFLNRADVYEP